MFLDSGRNGICRAVNPLPTWAQSRSQRVTVCLFVRSVNSFYIFKWLGGKTSEKEEHFVTSENYMKFKFQCS